MHFNWSAKIIAIEILATNSQKDMAHKQLFIKTCLT